MLEISISDFKLYYKATAIKTAWYWPQTDMKVSEQNRGPKYESSSYVHLIFDKGVQNIR
jgi:hypothetical protein